MTDYFATHDIPFDSDVFVFVIIKLYDSEKAVKAVKAVKADADWTWLVSGGIVLFFNYI